MKDEIKEILEFKEDADYKRLCVDEIVVLRDYITNLQEDLKYQKEMEEEYNKKHTKLMKHLQEERERLIRAWETAVGDFEKEYAKNERAKEVYIKELLEANNRCEDMPLVAIEMYNILEGNK